MPTLWAASPFALMRQFSMDLDRLFGDALTYDSATPQIEVFERGNQFVVRADLPGLSKNDVTRRAPEALGRRAAETLFIGE